MVSLYGKGMTNGDIGACLAEIYGEEISGDTTCRIADAIVEGMYACSSPVYSTRPTRGSQSLTAERSVSLGVGRGGAFEGADRMLAAALGAEVAARIARHVVDVIEDGGRLVVRQEHASGAV